MELYQERLVKKKKTKNLVYHIIDKKECCTWNEEQKRKVKLFRILGTRSEKKEIGKL